MAPQARRVDGQEVGESLPPPPTTESDGFLLLVADSDLMRATQLSKELADHGVTTIVCADGAAALITVGARRPDAVLAAATLPTLTGAVLAQALSANTSVPVIVGIGSGEGEAAASALAAGAAACIAQPYRSKELLPILRAIRPDRVEVVKPAVECGGLRFDPAALEVQLRGVPIRMPLREMNLLHYLMAHAGRVVTRDQIRDAVWDGVAGSNTVTVHVQRLRQRLGDDQEEPQIIHTVRGVGYRLVPPQTPRSGA